MKIFHPSIAILLLSFAAPALAQTPRIDPAGINGSLLICANGAVSQAAIDKFIDLAGASKAKIAVVYLDQRPEGDAVMKQLIASTKTKNVADLDLLRSKDLNAALPGLSGVWLTNSGAHWEKRLETNSLKPKFAAFLKNAGVVAVSGAHSDILDGLALMPGGIGDHTGQPADKNSSRGEVAFELKPGGALLIQGRTLGAIGDVPVTLRLAKSTTLPARTITLQGKAKEDLTALRRAARDRAAGFPPKEPEPPFVEKGTLVIVGGGGQPAGLFKKFVEYAGGKDKANIVIFPTAAESPLPKRDAIAAAFMKAGAKKATILYGQTLAEVESKEFLATLKEATGLWFDGGRQWRFVDCYENTKALPLMFDVLKRGGVIGGTSAGATIQGEYFARGGVFNNFDIRYEGYERGLAFLKGVAIDQHFTQRKRLPEMTQLMKVYPQYLGIGIDEGTAIVVKGSVADVIGKGKAHFYDAQRKVEKGQPDYEALSEGERYDLKARKVLSAGGSP